MNNIVSEKHKIRYNEFLDIVHSTGWEIFPLVKSLESKSYDKGIFLEHRIFSKEEPFKLFAKIEMNRGYSSTYFLPLNGSPIGEEYILSGNYLNQLGHEVGFCLDMLTIAASVQTQIHEYLIQSLISMLSIGIGIKGVSFFGNPDLISKTNFPGEKYFYNFNNEEGILRIKNHLGEDKLICWGLHSLEEYGLIYSSPVMVRRNHIIEDVSGTIRIDGREYSRKEAKEAIFYLLKNSSGRILASLTPRFWKMEE